MIIGRWKVFLATLSALLADIILVLMNAVNCCGGKPCCSFSFWQDPRVHYSHFWPSVLFRRQESARNASCTLKGSNMSQDWVSRRYTHMNPGSNYGVRIWLFITTYVGGIAGSWSSEETYIMIEWALGRKYVMWMGPWSIIHMMPNI